MIRILCLLAFVFANFPPVHANGNHDHSEKKGHSTPSPPTATVSTDSGGSNHRLRNVLLAVGAIYISYSWGGKKPDNKIKFGVQVKEAP